MKLCDAHAHTGTPEEIRARAEQGIASAICGTDPENAEKAARICSQEPLFTLNCGLHPWKTDRYSVRDMEPWLERCPVIGEIGMDSVWCSVPADVQKRAFRRQLAIAQEMGKRVVLHTKGCEEEIARILAEYDVRAVVHWYSCAEHLDRYLDLDCMFTVGPDAAVNPAVGNVVRRAGLDRLLTETDGLSAVEWAIGRTVETQELGGILSGLVRLIAELKEIPPEEAAEALAENYGKLI